GFICNAVMQVTANPCQLAVAASKDNFTTELIQKSKKIAICALSKNTRLDVIGTFGYKSGREVNKFANVQHIRTEDNLPVLTENVLAWFHGEVVSEIDLGSHILFVAQVDNCEIAGKDHDALTYTYYREVLKG
ncbi:MAG: flavin reductase family protein, partial [Bacteroidales bacterium]